MALDNQVRVIKILSLILNPVRSVTVKSTPLLTTRPIASVRIPKPVMKEIVQ